MSADTILSILIACAFLGLSFTALWICFGIYRSHRIDEAIKAAERAVAYCGRLVVYRPSGEVGVCCCVAVVRCGGRRVAEPALDIMIGGAHVIAPLGAVRLALPEERWSYIAEGGEE